MSSENGRCPSHLCPVVISPLPQVTWLVHVDICTDDNASHETAVSSILTKVNGSFFIGNEIDQTKIFSPSAASSLSLFLTAPPITFQWTLKHGASQGGSGPQRTWGRGHFQNILDMQEQGGRWFWNCCRAAFTKRTYHKEYQWNFDSLIFGKNSFSRCPNRVFETSPLNSM